MRDAEIIVHSTFAGRVQAMCLYWTGAVLIAAARRGHTFRLQAGTMSWRRLPEAPDDGVVGTHFTYFWEGLDHPKVRAQIAADVLPEMHVWVADPKRMEIIDLTTRYLPQQCEERGGLKWLMPPPPNYVWTGRSGLAKYGCLYQADRDACVLADRLYVSEFQNAGLL